MKTRHPTVWTTALLIGAVLLAACQPKTVIMLKEERQVRETVEVERAVTQVVEKEVVKITESQSRSRCRFHPHPLPDARSRRARLRRRDAAQRRGL